ncbi:MAG: DUF4129 domain-containing protein [Ferruginibacter sp.]
MLTCLTGRGQDQPLPDGERDYTIRSGTDITDSINSAFAEDVLGDTGVVFRDLQISEDSIVFWKNKKQYGWIKNLDSLLRADQLRDKKSTGVSMQPAKTSSLDRLFSSAFMEYLFWFLAAGFVVFVIIKLFMSKGLFRNTTAAAPAPTADDSAGMQAGKDYRALSRKAALAGDYRSATRYLFLVTLQQLDEKELIRFAPDKTNSMYLQELPAAKRNAFARISLYYEYSWYGNIPLQQETFEGIAVQFNAFLNTLNN